MIKARQQRIEDNLKSTSGKIKSGFKDLVVLLHNYEFNDIELDVIEKNIRLTMDAKNELRKKRIEQRKFVS
jgi:hypothetical protein